MQRGPLKGILEFSVKIFCDKMSKVLTIGTDSEVIKTVFHRAFLLMDKRAAVSSLSSSVTFGI
eukprot:7444348-Ditylum_brightwellii.AAC.1